MKHLYLLGFLLLVATQSLTAGEPIRILAIGNSFSQDAVEQNLHELAAAEGIETIVLKNRRSVRRFLRTLN